ncbi:MAG: hydrogenase maturation peptidase HycI [Candidatus Altiarchaeota archaeon]
MDLGDVFSKGKVSILCVGNDLNGDDGVGPYIYERIKDLEGEKVQIIDARTVPENFVGPIKDFQPNVVLVIDAADFGGKPGEWRFIEGKDIGNFSVSTHGMNLGLIEKMLGKEGIEVVFLGIQPKQTELGEGLSEDVRKRVENLISEIKGIIPQSSL